MHTYAMAWACVSKLGTFVGLTSRGLPRNLQRRSIREAAQIKRGGGWVGGFVRIHWLYGASTSFYALTNDTHTRPLGLEIYTWKKTKICQRPKVLKTWCVETHPLSFVLHFCGSVLSRRSSHDPLFANGPFHDFSSPKLRPQEYVKRKIFFTGKHRCHDDDDIIPIHGRTEVTDLEKVQGWLAAWLLIVQVHKQLSLPRRFQIRQNKDFVQKLVQYS